MFRVEPCTWRRMKSKVETSRVFSLSSLHFENNKQRNYAAPRTRHWSCATQYLLSSSDLVTTSFKISKLQQKCLFYLSLFAFRIIIASALETKDTWPYAGYSGGNAGGVYWAFGPVYNPGLGTQRITISSCNCTCFALDQCRIFI